MATALENITARNWSRAQPMSALFELTYVCNHACSFCYNCPSGQREMNTQEVIESLGKLAEFNVLYLTMSGGEPLVRRDFFDIAAAAKKLGFANRIYTNGYLIDQAMARRIKEVANPVEMEISIHGAKPETHDRLTCVPGSQQKILKAVKHLRAEGIKVNLKCPVTHHNQEEVLDLERIAQQIDARIQFDVVITPRDDGDKDPLSLMATDDFLRRYWSDDAYMTARKEKVPQPRRDAPGEAVCGTGRSGLAIDPYGNIYPCVQLRRKVANIRELKHLKEMWQTSPVLIDVRKAAVDVAQRVLKQEKAGDQCGSFCMGVAELQTGDAKAMYPQAAKNAEFRKQAYEAWEAKNGKAGEDDGGVLTRCGP